MKKNIEVEVRSFISKEQFKRLMNFMKQNAEFLGEDYQITYYFSGPVDLRIQKNDNLAKLWLKKGKIHDKYREELEIKFDKDDFEKLEKLLKVLGYEIEIKWFRDRKRFLWNGIKATVDNTRGYGYIIELEKLVDESEDKERIHAELEEKLKSLGVDITPKEIFEEKFNHYKKNWRSLTGS